MPIDPKKLAAYAGSTPAPKGGGSKPNNPPNEENPEAEMDAEGETTEEGDMGGDVVAENAELLERLEHNAEDIESCIGQLDEGMLRDHEAPLDAGMKNALLQCTETLDDSLVDSLREHLPDLPYDVEMELADHLADEGSITVEPEVFAGWLCRLGQALAA